MGQREEGMFKHRTYSYDISDALLLVAICIDLICDGEVNNELIPRRSPGEFEQSNSSVSPSFFILQSSEWSQNHNIGETYEHNI